MNEKIRRYKSYIIYIILFSVAVLFMDYYFKSAKASYLWFEDGVYQHFVSLQYVRNYLRDIVKGILFNREISFPFMNYTLGQGADIITTLNCYDFLDPIAWGAAILFRNRLKTAYKVIVYVKLLFAGGAFCLYANNMKKTDGWKVATGAIIYTFFGFSLVCSTRHPNFMSGMYFLPLTLWASELCIKKDKKLPLIFVTFFSVLTSYYSFYMDTIAFSIYVIIRLFPLKKDEIMSNLRIFLKLVIASLAGVMLSAVSLFPTIYAFLNNARTGLITGYTDSFWVYPAKYYKRMLLFFVSNITDAGNWTLLGFIPICFACIFVLFFKKKREKKRLKIFFMVGLLSLCVPFAGLIMNGFGYVSNRWNYVFALIISFIYVEISDEFDRLNRSELLILGIISVAYIVICICDETYPLYHYLPLILLVITMFGLCVINCHKFPKKYVSIAVIGIVLLSTLGNISVLYSPNQKNYISQFQKNSKVDSAFRKYSIAKMEDSAFDEQFYRVESQELWANLEGYNNVRGTSFWWSIMSGNILEYCSDLQLNTLYQNCYVQGFDGRNALLDLAAVKYYTTKLDDKSDVPYGYKKIREGVYENEYFLGSAFLYDNYILKNDLSDMDPLNYQQSMLQGIVLEEKIPLVNQINPTKRMKNIEYNVNTENVIMKDSSIEVLDGGGKITFTFSKPIKSELYLWLDGIQLDDEYIEQYVKCYAEKNDDSEKISCVEKKVCLTTTKYNWHVQREGVTFYLGYDEDGLTSCTLSFDNKAKYSYKNIYICENPIEKYLEDISKLQPCEEITFGEDYISGNVTCHNDQVLFISTPYSIGWSAYIDGKKTNILKANGMYIGIPLEKGEHNVELKYETPYLKLGVFISILTFGTILIYVLLYIKKNKTKQI